MKNIYYSFRPASLTVLGLLMLLTACASSPQSSQQPNAAEREVIDVSRTKGLEEEAPVIIDHEHHEISDLSTLNDLRGLDSEAGVDSVSEASDEESEPANIDENVRGTAPIVRQKPDANAVVNDGNAASRELLNSSQQMLDQGDFRLAANNAERALRVSPGNPHAYYQLALIYQKQSNHAQALNFAEKALGQKGVGASLYTKLWRVKADCYAALGDEQAAAQAREQANN